VFDVLGMKSFLCFAHISGVLLLLSLAFVQARTEESEVHGPIDLRRDPGDILWSRCQDLTITTPVGTVTLRNACAVLIEAEECDLTVQLYLEGQSVFKKDMSHEAVPQVCGPVTTSMGTCDICLSLSSDNAASTNTCLILDGSCANGFVSIPSRTLGCFPTTVLEPIVQCRDAQCPENCNGKGTCAQGVCSCMAGWYGADCSSPIPVFEQCTMIDQGITARLCLRAGFIGCDVQVALRANGIVIFNRTSPVSTLTTAFQKEQCTGPLPDMCEICYSWDNLKVNSTDASGCGVISAKCFGREVNYQLGCFDNRDIVPRCFGACPSYCSYHGLCVAGQCSCIQNYTGNDCSIFDPSSGSCATNCGGIGKGKCLNGTCQCNIGWGGDDCENPWIDDSPSTTSKVGMIVIPISVALCLAGTAAAWWYLRKKARSMPKFRQMDLEELQSALDSDPLELDESDVIREEDLGPRQKPKKSVSFSLPHSELGPVNSFTQARTSSSSSPSYGADSGSPSVTQPLLLE